MNPAQRIRVLADALDSGCSRKQAARVARELACELDQLIGSDVDAAIASPDLGTAASGEFGDAIGAPTVHEASAASAPDTSPVSARLGAPQPRT